MKKNEKSTSQLWEDFKLPNSSVIGGPPNGSGERNLEKKSFKLDGNYESTKKLSKSKAKEM